MQVIESAPVFAAAALSFALAPFVLRHGPQRRANLALALLLVFLGINWAGFATSTLVWAPDAAARAEAAFWLRYTYHWFSGLPLMCAALALATASRPPTGLWAHPTSGVLLVVAYGVVNAAVPSWFGTAGYWGGGPLSYAAWLPSIALAIVPLVFLRRAWWAADETAREGNTLLALGVCATALFFSARELIRFAALPDARPTTAAAWGPAALFLVMAVGQLVVLGAMWYASARAPSGRPRYRFAAWVLTAQVASGALSAWLIWEPFGAPATSFRISLLLWAVWMLAAPATLAYGILRGQVLDIDVRARRGVRRSTIAAAFIAAFFVASELAASYFTDRTGSTITGVAAAGALVFALAPLQRLADRVATVAVPPAPAVSVGGKEQAYRNALRFALRDRVLTREEELQLMHLADELGISARRALELRHELVAEPSSADPSSPAT